MNEEVYINDQWQLLKLIGQGSFGKIYLAQDKITKRIVAAKFTEIEASGNNVNQLSQEYNHLKSLSKGVGICEVLWYGMDNIQNTYYVMIMEALGPSIEELLQYCGGVFSMKTTCMIAIQMLQRIQFLHQNLLVHRDIKPDNFLMGTQTKINTVYVIDFGLSKHYINPRTNEHISFTDTQKMTGTARYCSVNTHSGYEQSRRDDLEALGYMFVYFMKGMLPWQGLKGKTKLDKFQAIHQAKAEISADALTDGLSKEFREYVAYSKDLEFEQEPNYDMLRSLFWNIMKREGQSYDCEYDWYKVYNKK